VILAVLGVLAVLAAVAAAVAGVLVSAATQSDSGSFDSSAPVERVVLKVPAGTVTVGANGGSDRVTGTWRTTSAVSRTEVWTGLEDGVLTVTVTCGTPQAGQCGADLDLLVPRDAAVDVTVELGDLEVSGLDGAVTSRVDVGAVTMTDMHSRDVDTTVAVGGVRLEFAAPPDTVTVSGDVSGITVVVPADGTAYAVTTRVDVGDPLVDIPTDPSAPQAIRVSTDVGALVVTTPEADASRNGPPA
jgi:hypothetical protein